MEYVGVKLSIPYGVAIVSANARNSLQVSPNLREVRLDLEWIMVEGVNGIATQIRSRNHMFSALVKGLIFTKAHVRSLGMGMGRCQAPNLT